MFPSDLGEIEKLWSFPSVPEQEQCIIDSEKEIRTGQSLVDKQTYNPALELYALKPKYDVSEQTKTEGTWYPSLYRVDELSMVVHAGGDVAASDKICISLYTDDLPYSRMDRVSLPK